jgi:type II secretion system protein H
LTRRPNQLRGFTLIELILVLIIISIMLAMASPTLRGWGQGQKLRNSIDSFIAATGYARSQAVTQARPHAVEIDSTANTYLVQSIETGGVRKPVPGDFGVANTLPEGYTIRLVSGGSTGSATDGASAVNAASVIFYPDARATPAVVEIKAANGEIALIECQNPAEPFKRADVKP